jgi:hypothetical protein
VHGGDVGDTSRGTGAVTVRRPLVRATGVVVLLAGVVALVAPPGQSGADRLSWETLLAPYSLGAALPDGHRIDAIRRGGANEVVILVSGAGENDAAQVHVLPRGCWSGIRESASFGIGYETALSPAPQREAITETLANAVRSRDRGLPPPDAIPLRSAYDLRDLRYWMPGARGWRAVLLVASLALLACVVRVGSPRLALAGAALGGIDVLVRAFDIAAGVPTGCPIDTFAIDLATRGIQLAWAALIVSSPFLCWRGGRSVGVGGRRMLVVVSACALLALGVSWSRGDEPLHANGHAWREAREVLAPGGGEAGAGPFLHGRGAIALQWMIASGEHALTGSANPFRISRLAMAAAAGSSAFLAAVLVGSVGAGLAAGVVAALFPLARTLAVSGTALTVPAWLLPWSLGLLLSGAASGDRVLLAGAGLAAALGIISHTAMLAWAPALLIAWLAARPHLRGVRLALGTFMLIAVAWTVELTGAFEMLASRNQGPANGLLGDAQLGLLQRDLLLDPRWVSPLLVPLAAVAVIASLRRGRASLRAAVAAVLVGSAPFFAVVTCSSDAVRYQGALLGLLIGVAVAGVWEMPFASRLGSVGTACLRAALLAGLVLLPLPWRQPPLDPATVEHQLVVEAAARMEPGTLVVLPANRLANSQIIVDFPDFLLPPHSSVAFEADPAVAQHAGPRLMYLGLACISWADADRSGDRSQLRPECRNLRAGAHPWLVRSLRAEDLPRRRDGELWTFHHFATGVPFGFFAPDS